MEKEKKEKLIQLGRFVRHKRTVKGISTYQIEKDFNVDRALWSKIENGKLTAMPKPELLIQIAEIISCNCIELYKLIGYIEESDIYRYISDLHRVREKDSGRKSMKP